MNQQKSNKKPFFRFVKMIIKIFKRKPKFIYLGRKPNKASIYISNHSAASGPVTYELYLPTNYRMWGAAEMCGSFSSRWRYMAYIYLHNKKKIPLWLSVLISTIITPFMFLFYKGMLMMPSYTDGRLKDTIRDSVEELKNNISILIFPENSSDGYHEQLKEYFGGFYMLAKHYYEIAKKDIDIVAMYYHRKTNQVFVANPESYLSLKDRFSSHKEVSKYYLDLTNDMYITYILGEKNAKIPSA